MLQAIFTGKRRIECREAAAPTPGRGDVRIEVAFCGVCGSDLHTFHSGDNLRICPGHELSGTVAAVGAAVSNVREGDRIALEPLRTCGKCERCRSGDYQLCPSLRIFGAMEDGGMAHALVAPASSIYLLPDSLPLQTAALAEPIAVAVHAARLAGVTSDSNVLILGAGTIGLATAAVMNHLDVASCAITARHPQQEQLAHQLGCHQVLAPENTAALDRAPDVVIETVGGRADTLDTAVRVVAPGGTIGIVGVFEDSPVFDPVQMLVKEVRMVASMVYGRHEQKTDFATALEILTDQRDKLQALITHEFPLEDAQKAFETADDKKSGAVKVLLKPTP